MEYNIYCDESCHLKNDDSKVMVLGAVWCIKEKKRKILKRIREIKPIDGVPEDLEKKRKQVCTAKKNF